MADLYDKSLIDVENALRNARTQAMERRYDKFITVDVDSHHSEGSSWRELVRHMDDGPLKQWAIASGHGQGSRVMGVVPGNQRVSNRIIRAGEVINDADLNERLANSGGKHPDVVRTIWSMDMMGVDYTVMFPGPMLGLGLNPIVELEVAVARAYNRWLTREILPQDDRIKTLIYLPFNDAEGSLSFVEEFHDAPGVVGFVITTPRHVRVHENKYAPVFSAIQQTGKPVGFHSFYNWSDSSIAQVDKFISAHSLGFVLGTLMHITNWLINGMPERYPDIDVIWIESGLAWIPFLMQRLDNEYMMRSSEAPLLTKPPSEYMRKMFYSSQPMERGDLTALENTFEVMNARETLLYSSDYPHWDCDMPSTIYDLPFLSEEDKRAILGGTAARLFGIDPATKGRWLSQGERVEKDRELVELG